MLIKRAQVDDIIGKAKKNGRVYYLVKWTNKDIQDSSWELSDKFSNIKHIVAKFNQSLPSPTTFPYIHQDYEDLLQDKLDLTNSINKRIEKPLLKGRVQTFLGKAKVMLNTFYLIKWQNQPLSVASWEESYRFQSSNLRNMTLFNKSISAVQLPYIDETMVSFLLENERDKRKSLEKNSKKDQLRDKKDRKKHEEQIKEKDKKQNEAELEFVLKQFRKKLKSIYKTIAARVQQKSNQQSVHMEINQEKQNQKLLKSSQKKLTVKEQQSDVQQIYKQNILVDGEYKPGKLPLNTSDQQQQVNVEQMSKIEQNSQDSYCLPPLADSGSFDSIDGQRVVKTIQRKIQYIEAKKMNNSQSTSQEKTNFSSKKDFQKLPKIEQILSSPENDKKKNMNKSSDEEKIVSSSQKLSSSNSKHSGKISSSNESSNLGKIILIKHENRIQAISGKSKEEQLYRFEYEKDGKIEVRFWTSSQVKKMPSHCEALLQYLEKIAFKNPQSSIVENFEANQTDKYMNQVQ